MMMMISGRTKAALSNGNPISVNSKDDIRSSSQCNGRYDVKYG